MATSSLNAVTDVGQQIRKFIDKLGIQSKGNREERFKELSFKANKTTNRCESVCEE